MDPNRADTHKWKVFGVLLIVCLFLCFFSATLAEAFRHRTNWGKRVDLSEKILRGQVIDVRSYWNSKKALIYTDITVLVDEHIKGDGQREITITIPGGTIGDVTHQVSDTPHFGIGDYGVILLESSGQVVGGPDGFYLLRKPMIGADQLQLLTEDKFLSWIKAYTTGQTRHSFEEISNQTSGGSVLQDTSYATISGVSPSTISAGTGDVLTVSGSGFGASRGSGNFPTIAFRYDTGSTDYMYDNSKIRSWSDTQIQLEVWTGIVAGYDYSPGSWSNPNGTVTFRNSSGNFESFWSLTVPFGYGRAKWSGSTVSYYANETGGPSGTLSAFQSAANTWSGAGANFSFNYAGSTTQGLGYDGYNVLSFADLGSSTIIAQAITYFSGGNMIEADIQFNTRFPFSTDPVPPSNKMDLESITVHELGHWLRLLDLYGANDAGKVMYGFGSYGQVKRNLTPGDQQGIQWIYPGNTTSPTPNPMTWATPPYAAGGTSISMVAATATESINPPVSYYFNFVGSPTGGTGGLDSGWQSSTTYTNSGLQTNHQYGYRVKAKNAVGNETGYSTPTQYVYTFIENPSGISFGTLTSSSIQVQSINTPSGLTRGSSGLMIENTTNGNNSGWKQNNSFWTSSSLSPNTSYSFRGKARNGDSVETAYSPIASKYTLASVPGIASFSSVTQTCIRANWTANGNPNGTQYFCENSTTGSNSGWTTNTYWDSCGLACGSSYSFRVKTRNGEGVETGWTSLGSNSTLTCSTLPTPPTNVSATDGTYMDRVEVTWTASPNATSYTVYRATSTYSWVAKTALGTITGTSFNDTTAVPMKTYYYWVKASNTYGTSGFSGSNAGSRSDGRPPAPTNVMASDGTYMDRVEVTWTASPNATSYTVYRATSTYSWVTKTALGTTTNTTFDDTTASVGKTYYYWLKASNAFGMSAFSAYDMGYRP
jgi:hypothetical protein